MFFRFSGTLALVVALVACGESDPSPQRSATAPPPPETSEAGEQWGELTRAESLILELDQSLGELAFALRNLELPDDRTRNLFAPVGLRIEDLGALPEAPNLTLDQIGARVFVVAPAAVESERIPIGLQLWKPLLDRVERLDYAKLQIRRGGFVPGKGEREDFEGQIVFLGARAAPLGRVRCRLGCAQGALGTDRRLERVRTGKLAHLGVAHGRDEVDHGGRSPVP